jgi:hypothetical protein
MMNSAVQVAREKVRNILGELIELHPTVVPEDWISEYSGITDIEYVDPKSVAVHLLEYRAQNDKISYHSIQPKQVVFLGGFYVIREEGTPDHWFVGELGESGFIDCWGRFDTLKEAIDSIDSSPK